MTHRAPRVKTRANPTGREKWTIHFCGRAERWLLSAFVAESLAGDLFSARCDVRSAGLPGRELFDVGEPRAEWRIPQVLPEEPAADTGIEIPGFLLEIVVVEPRVQCISAPQGLEGRRRRLGVSCRGTATVIASEFARGPVGLVEGAVDCRGKCRVHRLALCSPARLPRCPPAWMGGAGGSRDG